MCGIAVLLRWRAGACPCGVPPWPGGETGEGGLPTQEALAGAIAPRGIDSLRHVEATMPFGGGEVLELTASTLCLRGVATTQPLVDSHGNVLLFNGQIFGGDRVHVAEGANDSSALLAALSHANDDDAFSALLSSLQGPWAVIYWQPSRNRLWFGRDPIGRRSLLVRVCADEGLALVSTAPAGFAFQEVPPFGPCYVDIAGDEPILGTCWRRVDELAALSVPGGPPPPLGQLTALPSTMRRRTQGATGYQATLDAQILDLDGYAYEFYHRLSSALERRLVGLRSSPAPDVALQERRAQVAVLFSGGIDSLVVARLLDMALPTHCSVDLINVSFGAPPFASPDRTTALIGLEELAALSPLRPWRFVAVDVTAEEVEEYRERIKTIILPSSTPMDASIATALWFAARGRGSSTSCSKVGGQFAPTDGYETPASVLFSGLGADEQLAGYKGRHRTVFQRGGLAALANELDSDVSRLWWRNLGRDDRVVGDHGREMRFPFLDEDVIAFLASLPLKYVTISVSSLPRTTHHVLHPTPRLHKGKLPS